MRWAGTRILTPEGLTPGSVLVGPEGRVHRLQEGQPEDDPDLPGVVAPAPTNAHTHLADRRAREKIDAEGLSVEEAVAPPDGLKHRLLRSTPTRQLVEGMREALEEAHRAGVQRVLDFREGGPRGARALREAAEPLPVEVTVLGRPSRAEVWDEEKDLLVDLVDGIGVSGLEDQPLELSRAQARWADDHGKRLALHLSEARQEDVDAALSLDPDLIVHATECTEDELARIADAGVPVAACPRCNALFDRRPPLTAMVEAGIDVGLGTDNAMFHEPDPFDEAAFVAREWPGIDAEEILAMACSFALEADPSPTVEEGGEIVVVDDRDGLREGIEDRRIQAREDRR
jgi:cytosine/adenosine deaminase-related metal-dependent hydrolase